MTTMLMNMMIPSDGNGKGRGGGCWLRGVVADRPWLVLGRVTKFDGRCHVQEFVILGSSHRCQAAGLGILGGPLAYCTR